MTNTYVQINVMDTWGGDIKPCTYMTEEEFAKYEKFILMAEHKNWEFMALYGLSRIEAHGSEEPRYPIMRVFNITTELTEHGHKLLATLSDEDAMKVVGMIPEDIDYAYADTYARHIELVMETGSPIEKLNEVVHKV